MELPDATLRIPGTLIEIPLGQLEEDRSQADHRRSRGLPTPHNRIIAVAECIHKRFAQGH